MGPLVLHHGQETLHGPCGLCGKSVALPPGLQLCGANHEQPVCAECGRRVAPALTALQGLASVAEHVGRLHAYTVCLPLTTLLELARAAEKYTCKSGSAAT